MNKTLLLILSIFLFLSFSCEETTTGGKGDPPAVSNMTVYIYTSDSSIPKNTAQTIYVDVNNAAGTASYSWYLDDVLIVGEDTDSYSFQASELGDYVIRVAVTDDVKTVEDSLTMTIEKSYSITTVSDLTVSDNARFDDLYDVDVSGNLIAFVTGTPTISYSEDNGTTWTDLTTTTNPEIPENSANMVIIEGSKLYIAMFQGLYIYDTANGSDDFYLDVENIQDMVIAGTDIYLATNSGLMVSDLAALSSESWTTYNYASDDSDNDLWTSTEGNRISGIALDSSYIYLKCDRYIIRSAADLRADSWQVFTIINPPYSSIADDRTLWSDGTNLICGSSNFLYASSDNGATWPTRPLLSSGGGMTDILSWGNNQIATQESNYIYISSNQGESWSSITVPGYPDTGFTSGIFAEGAKVVGNTIYIAHDGGLYIGTLTED